MMDWENKAQGAWRKVAELPGMVEKNGPCALPLDQSKPLWMTSQAKHRGER
jgi:hypothetical protein